MFAAGCASNRELLVASAHGDVLDVREALRGGRVDGRGSLGQTALMNACARGDVAIVHELLAGGADVAVVDPKGRSPLWYAAANGHTSIVARICDHVLTNPSALRLRHGRLVCELAEWGMIEDLERVLKAGADPNAVGTDDWVAVNVAVWKQQHSVVKVLLAFGASADGSVTGSRPDPPVCVAATRGDLESVRILASAGASMNGVDSTGLNPLMHAVLGGFHDVARALVELGASVDQFSTIHGLEVTPLAMSLWRRDEMMAALLVEAGATMCCRLDGQVMSHADLVEYLPDADPLAVWMRAQSRDTGVHEGKR
jgi:ankyrin repeat protein